MRKINAVGIDVSKRKSMVTILRPDGELVARPIDITHLSGNIRALANRIKSRREIPVSLWNVPVVTMNLLPVN